MSGENYFDLYDRLSGLDLELPGSEGVASIRNFNTLLKHHIGREGVRDIDGLFGELEIMAVPISPDVQAFLERRGIFIESHMREVNFNKVSWCVDERLIRSRYFPLSDSKIPDSDPIEVRLSDTDHTAVTIKRVPFELSLLTETIPSTPFPGGKVGFYGATALAEVLELDNEVSEEPEWWMQESGQAFIESFLEHIVQKTNTELRGTPFEKTPVHIDDHGDSEDDRALIASGLGCGYSMVFLNVLYRQLSIINPELADRFRQKLGDQCQINSEGDLEYLESPDVELSIPKLVAKTLIHSAIASGSPVYILTGSHDADGIVYSLSDYTVDAMVVGADSQAVDSSNGSNVTLFESTLTWLLRRDGDPVYDLLTKKIFNGDAGKTQIFGLTVNNFTYDLLGQGDRPLYCVPRNFAPFLKEPLP